ncbi:MAG: translation factor GTPase family protein [Salinivirgaceae bacterium]
MSKTINIGIFAHVDAGKTTITENALFVSGAVKQPGSVDAGTAITDQLEVERLRGISVRADYTAFQWNSTQINIVDTPGHVDFSGEVQRVLSVIDIAVLVVSAVEGVQAHTESLWNVLHEQNIPTFFFINKLDRAGADAEGVIAEIQRELTPALSIMQEAVQEGTDGVLVQNVWQEQCSTEDVIETLFDVNEEVAKKFLNEESMPFQWLDGQLKMAFDQHKIFPVFMGSAKLGLGIEPLLDAITHYGQAIPSSDHEPFGGVVFGVLHQARGGRACRIKITDGQLRPRDVIKNQPKGTEEKVTQIKKKLGAKIIDVDVAKAGEIVDVYGLSDAQIGDSLGVYTSEVTSAQLQTPLLTVQVEAEKKQDYASLAHALQLLTEEDPFLAFEWYREEQELHVKTMGLIQMEVLESLLKTRFGIAAKCLAPTVIYKETPAGTGVGKMRYTMPKPCWAVVTFQIEPGVQGSGVSYKSVVSVDHIHQKYQNEVERTIPEALKQGIKGWEVTDIVITLVEGEDHEVHSRPGDFIIATPMAIMQGLEAIGTTFLEPVLKFKITADEQLLGAVTGDITQMRGTFDSPLMENGKFILTGLVPLSDFLDYPVKLSSLSGGKAKILYTLHSYKPCTDEKGVVRAFKGISPLHTSKYILKARNALQ